MKINILGIPIEIVWHNDRAEQCGADNDGASVLAYQKIFLDKHGGKEYTESIFLHEIIETINRQCELELEHNKISVLAANLYQVLKDNNMINFNLKPHEKS